MGLNSKIPYLVTDKNSLIVLKGKVLDDLTVNPRPILWNNEGLYLWIPAIRVRNYVSVLKDDAISKKNNNDLSTLLMTYAAVSAEQLIGVNRELAQAIDEMSKLLKGE